MATQTRPTSASGEPDIPTFAAIREKVNQVFGKRACLWQCQVGQAILNNRNAIVDVATGMGKTLSFLIPTLFRSHGIQVIVTALNVLGKQNEQSLQAAGIRAISISAETATQMNFRDIEEGKYRIVIISPEQMMKPGGGFDKLLRKPTFAEKIYSVVFDEAHCISEWGSFRPEYRDMFQLRYRLPRVSFVFASATFTPAILADIKTTFNLTPDRLTHIHRANDRPNIHIAVRKIQHALNSFLDLAFLVPDGWAEGDPPPPKFVIFFDSISDAVNAGRFLRRRLPPHLRHKIKWFHSDMSSKYKERTIDDLREGRIWGLCATDSFGMGVDLPNILLVIQWRVLCKMTTLWQRLGRGARDQSLQAIAIIFAEAKWFDEEIAKREHHKAQRRTARKRKSQAPPRSDSTKHAKVASAPSVQLVEATSQSHESGDDIGASTPGTWFISTTVGEDGAVEQELLVAHDVDQPELDDEASSSQDGEADDAGRLQCSIELVSESRIRMSADELIATRRELYREEAKGDQSRALVKRGIQELDLPLQDLINADSRGIGCRRIPFKAYFSPAGAAFDTNDDHCDPSGCSRCSLPAPPSCCDLHDPERSRRIPLDIVQHEKRSRRSRIRAFEYEPGDFELRNALQKWRDVKARDTFGIGNFQCFGGALVMPNELLDRVVGCAHFGKISTVSDLRKETQWEEAEKYGAEILALLLEHSVTRQILPVTASSEAAIVRAKVNKPGRHAGGSARPRSTQHCSVCRQPGHNKSNKMCPGYRNPVYVPCETIAPPTTSTRGATLTHPQCDPPSTLHASRLASSIMPVPSETLIQFEPSISRHSA